MAPRDIAADNNPVTVPDIDENIVFAYASPVGWSPEKNSPEKNTPNAIVTGLDVNMVNG